MPDYSKGKIYTIRCRNDTTLIYVGSTIQTLAKRWGGHKKQSAEERNINRKIYKAINGEWNLWYIELYENCPCKNKEELCKREGEVIRLIGTLNTEIAGRDGKQWYIDNKEYLQVKEKLYREDNETKISLRKQKYYLDVKKHTIEQITCECGGHYISPHKTRHLKTKKHQEYLSTLQE